MAEKSDKSDMISKMEAIGFVWEVFLAVALPSAGFAYLGRRLDEHFQSAPWFTCISLILALVLSGFLVSRMAMKFAQRMKTNQKT